MNILFLGGGKTGSIAAEIARERGHSVEALRSAENQNASALTFERLRKSDLIIDFTTPDAVLHNIEACIAAKKNIVVGTTGWYEELPKVRQLVEQGGTGFLFGANFSVGVNLLYEIAQTASTALRHHYFGQIFERHHVNKKDAPSGTAIALQNGIRQSSEVELEITSFREGDVVGMHELVLDSPNDTIYVCHDAKSRRGFGEGAVRGAEWLADKKGFFDFRDVWRRLE
ncbi:MAG: dihydrodipicolinate reductase [Acidobacteriaceae bacterium]|jgi:4-hydroxy-tetrahydrodipicolinate reductase|nr:dihydrodipicolinate reductase [Acidobacteriaceae bacterium]